MAGEPLPRRSAAASDTTRRSAGVLPIMVLIVAACAGSPSGASEWVALQWRQEPCFPLLRHQSGLASCPDPCYNLVTAPVPYDGPQLRHEPPAGLRVGGLPGTQLQLQAWLLEGSAARWPLAEPCHSFSPCRARAVGARSACESATSRGLDPPVAVLVGARTTSQAAALARPEGQARRACARDSARRADPKHPPAVLAAFLPAPNRRMLRLPEQACEPDAHTGTQCAL